MPANRQLLEQVAAVVVADADELTHLGTGGFASTFKIVHGGDMFALKIVDAANSDPERVERELAALRRVTHPGVVAYRDTGIVEHDGERYRWLSMDFIDGQPLTQVLQQGRQFTLLEAVDLVRQAVDAAGALWSVGTAHRDLTPNNIMITAEGRLVIVDLGLARHLDDETITSLPTPGTPGWMSPEQVGADPQHGDWRSDQYVLGLLAFLLTTGVLALHGRSPVERWLAPAVQTPRPARELNPEIPPVLSDLIDRMLSKAPHRRFLKLDALLAELDRAQAALAISTTTTTTAPRFHLVIGTVKSYAADGGFLTGLAPDGVVVDARARARTSELVQAGQDAGAVTVIDPVSHFARSPINARPAF